MNISTHFRKLLLLCLTTLFSNIISTAQVNLVSNGDFETLPFWTSWSTTSASSFLWTGVGACTPNSGIHYVWFADQQELNGVNSETADMFQVVNLPSNASSIELKIYFSINTTDGQNFDYDYVRVRLRSNSTGSILHDFGYLSNTSGVSGIPGCQNWFQIIDMVPNQFFGQSVRLSIEFETDVSNPTIFRVDDVELWAQTNCNYSVSTNYFLLPGSGSGTYNVATVSTSNGCNWNANVSSGNSWLSTTSTGNGNGSIVVNVNSNTTGVTRTGTVELSNQTITIEQPGSTQCSYVFSSPIVILPNNSAGTFTNITNVNTTANCTWNATVITGGSWLMCNSGATGSGDISVSVTENNTAVTRKGVIEIGNDYVFVDQPGLTTSIYTADQSNFKIWPIPASDIINLQVDQIMLNSQFEIFDLTGRSIKLGLIKSKISHIDLTDYVEGIYILKIYSPSGILTEKFVVH